MRTSRLPGAALPAADEQQYHVVCGCRWPTWPRERTCSLSWCVVGHDGERAPSSLGHGRRWNCTALVFVGMLLLLLLLLLLLVGLPPASAPPASAPPAYSTAPPKLEPPIKSMVPPSLEPLPNRVQLVSELYEAGHARPHPELCPTLGAHLQLLVLVSSAPSHAAARKAVRLTWGHFAARADVAVAFVLGAPPAALRAALDAEDALYGDIIEGRSVDTYSNLTLKTLSMLEWADTYCPRAPRLLKTDDDMFINVARLLQFAAAPARANATRTIWGKIFRSQLPHRILEHKYYVSPLQFPGAVYPDYASGPAYLLTADCVRALLEVAPTERYVRLEDVFVTGVLAARLRLHLVHAPDFYNDRVELHACTVQAVVSIHKVRYHEQFDLWRKLLDKQTKCAS